MAWLQCKLLLLLWKHHGYQGHPATTAMVMQICIFNMENVDISRFQDVSKAEKNLCLPNMNILPQYSEKQTEHVLQSPFHAQNQRPNTSKFLQYMDCKIASVTADILLYKNYSNVLFSMYYAFNLFHSNQHPETRNHELSQGYLSSYSDVFFWYDPATSLGW
jgi:hypothetical protein